MKYSESLANIASALSKFQAEVKQPKKDKDNPFFRSKYVPLESVISAIAPTLEKHGLSYYQSTGTNGESAVVTTLVMHSSGEYIESDPLEAPALQSTKGNGKEYNAQGVGSAITYLRRYSLTAALGIASEDDDDGNSLSGGQGNKPEQKQKLVIPPALSAKYETVKGSKDGMEQWVSEKIKEGMTMQQIEQKLTEVIINKQKETK